MMNEDLRGLLTRQKQSLDEFGRQLEQEISRLENAAAVKESTDMSAQTTRLEAQIAALKEQLAQANKSTPFPEIQNRLHERLYNEKINLTVKSEQKMEAFFAERRAVEYNRLLEYENRFKAIIEERITSLRSNNIKLNEELIGRLNARLNELNEEIRAEITAAKEHIAESASVTEEMKAGYNSFRQEPLIGEMAKIDEIRKEDEQIVFHEAGGEAAVPAAAAPERQFQQQPFPQQQFQQQPFPQQYSPAKSPEKKSFERFIGLNLLNKVGVALIVLAVIFFSQYTYRHLGDAGKSVLMFGLGGFMLGLGEFLSRKKANVFSLGISAGGVSVIYAALAVSYFSLGILPDYIAAALCIVITAGTFFLSVAHNSQVIAVFAVTGGFISWLAVSGNLSYNFLLPAIAYFLILCAFTLSLSFKKKWTVAAYFGFVLNAVSMVVTINRFSDDNKILIISYITLSFLFYTLIPIIGTFMEGSSFKKSDTVLIALNTTFSALTMYAVFGLFEWEDYYGLLALIFMLSFIGLGFFMRRKMREERDMGALFFLTALVFYVLIIPLQFDIVWLSLGWLAEGLALAVYGILTENRRFKTAGMVINGLCFFVFIVFDLFGGNGDYFAWKYLSVTLGAMLILGAFTCKSENNDGVRAFKYLSFINLWIYFIYVINKGFGNLSLPSGYSDGYFYTAACIFMTFALAFALPRIKLLKDGGMRVLSHVFHWLGIGWLFLLNAFMEPVYTYTTKLQTVNPSAGDMVIGSLVLVSLCLVSIFALADMLYYFTQKGKLPIERFPFILSCYFTVILTETLIHFYKIPFAGFTLTVIYAVLAFAWCVFGFWKRYAFMRRFGLASALLVVGKLFFIDLWALTEGYRIISFFALGITLVGISFVYQYFTKKLKIDE